MVVQWNLQCMVRTTTDGTQYSSEQFNQSNEKGHNVAKLAHTSIVASDTISS
jgi:hypothetical protein